MSDEVPEHVRKQMEAYFERRKLAGFNPQKEMLNQYRNIAATLRDYVVDLADEPEELLRQTSILLDLLEMVEESYWGDDFGWQLEV